jgi:hypothetical protein
MPAIYEIGIGSSRSAAYDHQTALLLFAQKSMLAVAP